MSGPPDERNDAAPPGGAGTDKREAERRRDGRRVTERQEDSVRAAIRSELAVDRPTSGEQRVIDRKLSETTPIIQLDRVSLAFDKPILEDISFPAQAGETICVVGESGTGKSTILKLILRHLVPDRGCVNINGEDITHLTFEEALEVRQHMGMVFQGAALFDSMSAFENVAYPLREHTKLSDDEIEQRVREKLQFVDLDPDEVMDQLPSELSGGMRKRVGIARGLANNPEIMLYDEPTSGLDPLTTGTITRLIMKLQRELNVTSIVVSHDIRSVSRMATKVAVLHDRRIVFFGTPEEMSGSDDTYLRDFLGGY
jgi:phospholipid/cholesterol/gamma-HCH transport system ATP-binding protein